MTDPPFATHARTFLAAQRQALYYALTLTLMAGIPMIAIWFAMVLLCRDVDTTRGVMGVFGDAGKPYAETTKVFGWVAFWSLKLVAASVTGRRKLIFSPLIDLSIDFCLLMLVMSTIYACTPTMTFGVFLGCVFLPLGIVEVLWHVFFLDKVDGLKTWWRLVKEYSGVHFGFFALTLYAQLAELLVFTVANLGTKAALQINDTRILTPIQLPLTLFLALGLCPDASFIQRAPIMKILHKRIYSFMPQWKTPPPKDRNEEILNNVKMV
ncbi:hypothetical protein HK101_011967 [Irineochytrium annulatum]|nr:hypothetical protein HK101_011967 [Irineochytrium annulatum]